MANRKPSTTRILNGIEAITEITLSAHDPDLRWLAGLLEGEGHFKANPPAVILQMTDEDVVRRAASVVGCGSVTGPYQSKRFRAKPIWRWKTTRSVDGWVLSVLLSPHLGLRRSKEANALIAAYSDMTVGKIVHGTTIQYRRGCRCDDCRKAFSDYRRQLAPKLRTT